MFWGILLLTTSCDNSTKIPEKTSIKDTLLYLNHHDSAKYVGMNTCRLCHQDIYNTFIKTGMGKSFDIASKQKTSGDFSHPIIYDKYTNLYYKAFWEKDSMRIMEYRLQGKDTSYKRIEQVNYIIGSGQHTNSHMANMNGYLYQMPMTYYTQKKQWDLPPGFENGSNTRFSRKIELECMSCHNSYPDFILGSENKFRSVPEGINCERCHGPGSIHVAQKQLGNLVDTSKFIDYSIVNPAKLSIDLQFDVCQRCHLQGNTVLKEGKSFYDFKPGMKLNDFMTVFLPRYKHADDEFIMASHADRLKQSACFIKSLERTKNKKELKPYKNALTCITCHNPHVSVRETNPNVFNEACQSCHGDNIQENKKELLAMNPNEQTCFVPNKETANCVSCHMPPSSSIDIPHVSVHDHYIRKPITKKDKKALKEFIGLYAVNEKKPSQYTKAKAYINQFEKFESKPYYLDSALSYLDDSTPDLLKQNYQLLIQLYFNKNNFNKVTSYADKLTDQYLLNSLLTKSSYNNEHAWTCYRIGESFFNRGNIAKAIIYYKQSVKLAPFALDFRNKYATALMTNGLIAEAEKEYLFIIKENPKHVSALTNLGYLKISRGDVLSAEKIYFEALRTNPDYEQLLLNIAGLYAYKKEYKTAKNYIERILNKNPNHIQAKNALQQLQSVL